MRSKNLKGFTLIELLIVIGLIAVLAGAVIIALNPARQFANARNSERMSHLSALMSNIQTNMAENRGVFSCSSTPMVIPTSTTVMSNTGFNICPCLVPTYIAAMPIDPSQNTSFTDCGTYNTNYTIERNPSTNRITLKAPGAENTTISLTQ